MSRLTGTFDPRSGLVVDVRFGRAGLIELGADPADPQFRTYRGLIDTGARTSCISSLIALEVGLRINGRRPVASAHGVRQTNYYTADVVIPMDEGPPAVSRYALLLEVTGDDKHEAIIGLDFLQIAHLLIDGPQRRFTLSLPRDS